MRTKTYFSAMLGFHRFSSSEHTAYRFGFNGMEKDDEVYNSSGTSYDFGARMYSSRLGRWCSTDPKSFLFPSNSPYNFAGDNPVLLADGDGQEQIIYLYIHPVYSSGSKMETLSQDEINQILQKVQTALDKTGLADHFKIVQVDSPMELQYMDDSDVSAVISDPIELNTKLSRKVNQDNDGNPIDDPFFYWTEITSNAYGKTPSYPYLPAAAYLWDGEKTSSPNYLDQLAYQAMHEIVHRLRKLGNYFTQPNEHHEYGILMSPSRLYRDNQFPEYFKESIEDFPEPMFSLLPDVSSDISSLVDGVPVDNATGRKNAATGMTKPAEGRSSTKETPKKDFTNSMFNTEE